MTYGGQVIDPTAYIYIYICVAKAPFCAYIFGSNLLKTGEKWHFRALIFEQSSPQKFAPPKLPFLGVVLDFWPLHPLPFQ